jgi:hypothetical protein
MINIATPKQTPPQRFESIFMSVILKKQPCPARLKNEAAERPHQGWETSETKFDTLSDPHEMTMSLFFKNRIPKKSIFADLR